MPQFLASSLAVVFVLYALRLERRRNGDVSAALWIPCLWVGLIGTRYASQWLNVGSEFDSPADFLEGSPVDQAIFLILYAAALCVLVRRRIQIRVFLSHNVWLSIFLAYCLVSVLWSEYPWVALKRWIKVTEHCAMVLVVLSEKNIAQAIDSLFRRLAYVSITLSVLFIKYVPELGRGFDSWTGRAVNTGITTDKNALGHLCVLSGVALVAALLSREPRSSGGGSGGERLVDVVMICSIIWLLNLADAKTALVCGLTGAGMVIGLTRSDVGKNPKKVLACGVVAVLVIGIVDASFGVWESGIKALGRDATLTDRTIVWADVLAMENSVIFGTGFESFWLGQRAEELWQKYWWHPNQAHNGYIETFINLGAIGLLLLLSVITAGLWKSLKSLAADRFVGPLRFSMLVCIVIFNYTDASFKALHVLYFVFFLVVSEYPHAVMDGRRASGAVRVAILESGGRRRRSLE